MIAIRDGNFVVGLSVMTMVEVLRIGSVGVFNQLSPQFARAISVWERLGQSQRRFFTNEIIVVSGPLGAGLKMRR